jgi:hypothetical protein
LRRTWTCRGCFRFYWVKFHPDVSTPLLFHPDVLDRIAH